MKRLDDYPGKTLRRAALLIVAALCFQLSSSAALTPGLSDDYLNREFRWIMFLDCQDVEHYLNYPGSRLKPLTKVRVTLRTPPQAAKPYHDFWYHRSLPIGARRFDHLSIPAGQFGAIVVQPTTSRNSAYSDAIMDAILRLVLEMYTKQMAPTVVLVPEADYDLIVAGLGRYNFIANVNPETMQGAYLSIRFRPYPYDRHKDQCFYYRR